MGLGAFLVPKSVCLSAWKKKSCFVAPGKTVITLAILNQSSKTQCPRVDLVSVHLLPLLTNTVHRPPEELHRREAHRPRRKVQTFLLFLFRSYQPRLTGWSRDSRLEKGAISAFSPVAHYCGVISLPAHRYCLDPLSPRESQLLCSYCCLILHSKCSPSLAISRVLVGVFEPCTCLGRPPPKSSARWEGTHTYSRSDPKRPRTAAQVREEALKRIQEDRAKRNLLSERRRSLPVRGPSCPVQQPPSTPPPVRQPSCTNPNPAPQILESELDSEVEILSESNQASEGEAHVTMPGSNKKKRHASSAKPDEEGASGGLNNDLKAFLTSMKEDINRATNEAVDRIDKRIDENAARITELKEDMNRRDAVLETKISSQIRQEVAKIAATGTVFKPSEIGGKSSEKRERSYNWCRRTLKMWPVRGDDLVDEVKSFLSNHLGFNAAKIVSLGTIEVSRAPGRAANDRAEILATFETKEDRDLVKAGGVNLAGKQDIGMAVHVPGHLMDNLVASGGFCDELIVAATFPLALSFAPNAHVSLQGLLYRCNMVSCFVLTCPVSL